MKSKRVLFYYSSNKKTVALETLCQSIKDSGHDIRVLTICEKGLFHDALHKMDIKTFTFEKTSKNPLSFFFSHAQYLIQFCKEHQIEEVWSHLGYTNAIATLAQPFLSAKVTVFRHHAESAFYAEFGKQFEMKRLWKEVWVDKFVNRYAKKIIIPSTGVWISMDLYEKCDMSKVMLVPYIYDFSSYAKPNQVNIDAIKQKYPCQLRLIMVSRMISSKQHLPVFEILNELMRNGLDIKMIVMDEGPLRPDLEKYVKEKKLDNHIFFIGFQQNIIDYMAASDILIHPSLTEASSNVAKEMGLLNKTIAVCRDVGDFNEYIKDGENSFFLDRNNLKNSIRSAIQHAYDNRHTLEDMGKKLHEQILTLFSDTTENRQRFIKLL